MTFARYGLLPHLATSIAADSGVSSSSPAPSSPLLSPQTWSHKWPTPAWQCFVDGVMIRFLLPSTDTPWQKAEELGLKDKLAMKVRRIGAKYLKILVFVQLEIQTFKFAY